MTNRLSQSWQKVVPASWMVADLALGVSNATTVDAQTFMRADSNSDTDADITDPLFTLFYAFMGSTEPGCMDSADANDDGVIDITDTFYTLSYLFIGNVQLPSPGLICGPDDTEDSLGCAEYPYCDGISGISTFETPIQSLGSMGPGRDDNVSAPVLLEGVNLPGIFVDATPDGGTIYTHETRYDHVTYESHNFFHALALVDDAAFLQSSVEIPGYPNSFMVEDDAAFATTYRSETIEEPDGTTRWVSHSELIAIDLRQRDDISVASTTEVPFDWSYLQKVDAGRAFIGSWPGIFVYNVEDISAPSFEGFHRTQGWSQEIIVDGDRAWVPTGFYGVRILELD